MEKREKFLIVLMTVIILLGIFIAFIVSNSKKTPPEVLVQNEDRKIVSAVLGGYTWKVFGTNIINDAIDLRTYDFLSKNTVVSKTGEVLTFSTTEKFIAEEITYIKTLSNEEFDIVAKNNETGNYFTINAPELEGTYIYLFKLDFYGKGNAEYAVKVVVTDENIYDIEDIIDYKNTEILDISNIKDILSKLPYANKLNGLIINSVDTPIGIKIRYDEDSIEKEDLLNNTIALFALIPSLDNVTYDVNKLGDEIYFTRDEVNNLLNRNVLEYAEDIELWAKEVIYKEEVSKYNSDAAIYTSVISSALSNLTSNEVGDFIAIDIAENNTSGEIFIDEFDKKSILDELSKEYDLVLNVNKDEFSNNDGSLVIVKMNKSFSDSSYIVDVFVKTSNNERFEYSYKVVKTEDSFGIESNEEISGDVE